MSFPEDLIKSFVSKRVRLFVGSGVSSAASITGWDALVAEMKTTIRRESRRFSRLELNGFLKTADHLDIADVFRETVKDHRYFRFLREHYRRPVDLSSSHRALARLPVQTVFTTNYDKLLEKTFRDEKGTDPAVVIYPEQLGYIDGSETRIVKLHGDIDHPSTIVLTRSDYAMYEQRRRDFVREFQASVNDYTMLFAGFGLRDANFKRIYQDARYFYDATKRESYAFMTAPNGIDRAIWEKDGLIVLPITTHAELPKRIRDLEREIGRRLS